MAKGWWIINIYWMQESEENPIPEKDFAEEIKLKKLSGLAKD